nr:cell cycle checkpoint protein RAD17 [Ciona intestinalis]|eukprot:XP_018667503.1 cell cycle checkpoint protein RAD17 [Ciona intestinalis]
MSFSHSNGSNKDSWLKSRKRKLSHNSSAKLFPTKSSPDTWIEKYAPQHLEQLAVHKKKIQEVENWLIMNRHRGKKGGAPILFLSGPAGCGKTTTLVMVARKNGIEIAEWNNPLSVPYSVTKQSDVQYKSEVVLFEEFLFRSGKYPSLFSNPENNNDKIEGKLVLLEEFPNFMLKDLDYCKELVRRYRLTQQMPLVIIISDGSTFDSFKRFLSSKESSVTNIRFNPVSTTLLIKALSRVSTSERCSTNKDDLSLIASASAGDVRSAINNLQFSCKTVGKSTRKTSGTKSKAINGKDTSLIMFRALGKVFYCKREKRKKAESVESSKYRDDLIVQPEDILEQCCLSGSAFSLFLHQNYLPFFDANPIEDVASTLEYLSMSDVVGSSLTSSDLSTNASVYLDYYEGILAARGMTYSNSLRATNDMCASRTGAWRPLHKPAWFQVIKKKKENELQSHLLFYKLVQSDLMLSTLPYLFHLKNQSDLNFAQKMFTAEIVVLPKWKMFHNDANDQLTEHEAGSVETTDPIQVRKIEDNIMEVNIHDDSVEIEDFSD